MKTSKLAKKLDLKKETIAQLNLPDMKSINGGILPTGYTLYKDVVTECGCMYTVTLCGRLRCPHFP